MFLSYKVQCWTLLHVTLFFPSIDRKSVACSVSRQHQIYNDISFRVATGYGSGINPTAGASSDRMQPSSAHLCCLCH